MAWINNLSFICNFFLKRPPCPTFSASLRTPLHSRFARGAHNKGIWGSRPCGSSTQIRPAGRTSHIPQTLYEIQDLLLHEAISQFTKSHFHNGMMITPSFICSVSFVNIISLFALSNSFLMLHHNVTK